METPNSISEETIFSAALQHAPEERAAYLDRACAGNAAVRSRVEALLNAQPQLGSFMEVPIERIEPTSQGALRFALAPEERPGTCIGRYKLLQKLGEGGCGVVYMAEQEEPVRRRVALKVIKLGMDTKSVIARFEAERQALAMMDHPNIAKVLDGGATETGRSYFVMELVRGTKITEFCDQHRLSMRERLDLFIQVCQAVQHAHQKGIIHRDLKPSNILVTIHNPGAPGVPVIIDFGIAKATQGRLTDQTLFTAFEQFLGTPAYMSPEQTLMTVHDVDTRSDIYSLGALLYELLTGRTPFEGKELLAAGLEEMRRTIREKEPVRPSTRLSTLLAAEQATAALVRQTEPPKLAHLIRGDLDWIVMKCLEKDRGRRYETASALAMDLRRHLKNEPVLARPPSKLYEFQKTVRRHKVGFAATAAVMVALAAGVLVSLWQAAQARRAEREARRNAYVADMHVARQALTEGNLGGTRALLAKYLPAGSSPDLRGWEWRNLAHASRGDQAGYLVGHCGRVSDLFFLDNDRLLSVGWDRRIIWWDLPQRTATDTSTNTRTAQRHALSRDRRTLALAGPLYVATNVLLLDLATHTQRTLPAAFRGARLALDFSPGGDLAIGKMGGVSLWDGSQLRTLVSFPTNQNDVDEIRFTPDGRRLAVASNNGQIEVWDLASASRVCSWLAHQPAPLPRVIVSALRFSPDGRWLVSSGAWDSDRAVRVWNPDTGECIAELTGHRHVASPAGVLAMDISPDGRWLATAGGDHTVRVWETGSWTNREILRGHSDPVSSVAWSPDGRHLVTGSFSGELMLWDWPGRSKAADRVLFAGKSKFVDLAADTRVVFRVTETNPGVTEVWDTRSLQRTSRFPTPRLPTISYALALPGALAATGETNGMIRLWDTTGRQVASSGAGPSPVTGLQCSADGHVLVSRSGDEHEQVRVWSLPALRLRGTFQLEAGSTLFKALAVSADGSRLALGLPDGRVELRDLPGGQRRASWPAHTLRPIAMAFSPDNRLLATSGDDSSAAIWDLAGPRLIAPLKGNPVPISSLVFTPDGLHLALGLGDGTVKLCDAQTGVETASFHGHSQLVSALAFVPDGTELVSLCQDALCVCRAPTLRDLADVEMRLKSMQAALGR